MTSEESEPCTQCGSYGIHGTLWLASTPPVWLCQPCYEENVEAFQ
jgi:hypothetical protein